MLKHTNFLLIIISFMVLGDSLVNIEGYALENDSVGFSVFPNYSETQQKESSFFDLLVTPGSEQTISITVSNTSEEVSNYEIKVIQASTNKNGVIDYSDPKGQLSKKVPMNLDDQATYKKKFQLSPGEFKEVPIKLCVPLTPFRGEVLGGVNVSKEISEKNTQSQLVNQYSYVIGLRLREGAENPERHLESGDAKPDVSFGQTGVTVPIINNQAIAMGQLTVDSVLKRDGKEIKKETYKSREVAPG